METRTDRRKQRVREQILDAAFELFLARGVESTKIEDICERADVANRTFFNHFPTRQDMMRALGEHRLLNLHDVVLVDLPGLSAEDHLRELFVAVANRLDATSEPYRELIGAMLGSTGYRVERGSRLHETFLEVIKEGVAASEFGDTHDPNTLADIVTSTFAAAVVNWTMDPTYSLSSGMPASVEALLDMLRVNR